jgi:transcriptional regulator with XRE-family HTH domain
MAYQVNIEKMAALLRSKRADRGLREVADEIGDVSPSTLSRIENEKIPDLTTFLHLCNWLDIAPAELFVQENESIVQPPDTSESIALLLRADKRLDPTAANTLATLIKAAYGYLPGQTAKGE